MTKLYIQLLNEKDGACSKYFIRAWKIKSIVFNNTNSLSYLRQLQPASELIVLDYGKNEGRKLRFLRKKTRKKVCLVISDLHLGAGYFFDGKVNNLEDFNYDQELVQFFQYYSSGKYKGIDVEVVINGDFIDFLAVPYVRFLKIVFGVMMLR